jgi:hypothetical protein
MAPPRRTNTFASIKKHTHIQVPVSGQEAGVVDEKVQPLLPNHLLHLLEKTLMKV